MQWRLVVPAALLVAGGAVGGAVALLRGKDESRPPRDAMAIAGSRCGVSRAQGDFDGDGRQDIAVVYARLSPGAPCDYTHASGRYFLRLQLANGVTDSTPIRTDVKSSIETHTCSPLCLVIGAPDIDRNGTNELAIELGHGASEAWFGLYRLDRGRIERLTTEWRVGSRTVRKAAEFRLFGSLGHGGDFVCRTSRRGTPLVVQSSYGIVGPKSMVSQETVYAVNGLVLRRISTAEQTHPISSRYPPQTRGRRCLHPEERVLGKDPRS